MTTTTTTGAAATGTTSTSTGSTVTSTAAGSSTTVAPRVVDDPSDDVRSGDTGKGVEQIQFILKANGYDLDVDGEFGPVTETAVRDFQQKNGLTVDGVVGPITWAKLQGSVGTTTTAGSTSGGATTTTAASPSTT